MDANEHPSVDRHDRMLGAVEDGDGIDALRDLVQGLLDAGVDAAVLLEDLDQVRALVSEDNEDNVLDVMDLLTGW